MIKLIGFLILFSILTMMWGIDSYVDEHGGIKQTIIHLGKEAKDIGQAIGKD